MKMKKVLLSVEEKLIYHREIEVSIPNEMSESEFESVLDRAQSGEMLDDFLHTLKRSGIKIGSYDDNLSSPWSSEIECDGYDFVEDSESTESA